MKSEKKSPIFAIFRAQNPNVAANLPNSLQMWKYFDFPAKNTFSDFWQLIPNLAAKCSYLFRSRFQGMGYILYQLTA